MALTLLRAIGWLSRDDLNTRKENAGPVLPTPEAQCPGIQHFEYALYPFRGRAEEGSIHRESEIYQVPLLVHQGLFSPDNRAAVQFMGEIADTISITAIKKHHERDSLVIRLFSLLDQCHTERLVFYKDIGQVWFLNLIEERLSQVEFTDNQIELNLNPHEIATLELVFK